MTTTETCKDKVKGEYRKECKVLSSVFALMHSKYTEDDKKVFSDYFGRDLTDMSDDELCDTAYRAISDYGLSIDYVAPNTFTGQRKGYLRWQISWGGPSDEWRFYFVPGEPDAYRIEYWYMDWFDGAKVGCTGGRVANLLWNYLQEIDAPMNCYQNKMKDLHEG